MLIFSDEFNGSQLDENLWVPVYDPGNPGDGLEGMHANLAAEGGILRLIVGANLPKRPTKNGRAVTSIQTAWLTGPNETRGSRAAFAQKYGWFEIRCRMPSGSGLHAAFWLLHWDVVNAGSWPKGGDNRVSEIDVFEALGKETSPGRIHFNVHTSSSGHYEHRLGFDPSLGFHTYALEWRESELVWYVDGIAVHTYHGPTPSSPMLVLLGLYQGASSWTGPVDPAMTYPKAFEIDYVRVYGFVGHKKQMAPTR